MTKSRSFRVKRLSKIVLEVGRLIEVIPIRHYLSSPEMKSTLLPAVSCAVALFALSINSASTSSWIGLEKANRTNIKRYEQHCLGLVYNIGPMEENEVRRIPGVCAQGVCLSDRNINISGCPFVALNDRVQCHVYGGDLTKGYPECCHEIRCQEANVTGIVYAGFINMTAFDVKHKARKKKLQEESKKAKKD